MFRRDPWAERQAYMRCEHAAERFGSQDGSQAATALLSHRIGFTSCSPKATMTPHPLHQCALKPTLSRRRPL